VIERRTRMVGGAALRARLGIPAHAPLLALLPGSRSSEIRFIFPLFRDAVALLAEKIPGLITILPTVPHVAGKVRAGAQGWPTPLHIVENEDDKFAAFDAANVALAASGTVTAELALARTPMVVAYRVGRLTYALANRLMTARYMTLVNILLDRPAVPEFKQSAATPTVLADAVARLFRERGAAAAQAEALNEFGRRLGEGDEAPSARAARVLLDFISG
jgi:lipid-A-disaccharide synthase